MAEVANPQITDTISIDNMKTIGEAGSFAIGQQMIIMTQLTADSVAAAARRNALADGYMGQALKMMAEVDPVEAASLAKTLNADLPNVLAQLGTAIAQIQQVLKGAQTTPPPTA